MNHSSSTQRKSIRHKASYTKKSAWFLHPYRFFYFNLNLLHYFYLLSDTSKSSSFYNGLRYPYHLHQYHLVRMICYVNRLMTFLDLFLFSNENPHKINEAIQTFRFPYSIVSKISFIRFAKPLHFATLKLHTATRIPLFTFTV